MHKLWISPGQPTIQAMTFSPAPQEPVRRTSLLAPLVALASLVVALALAFVVATEASAHHPGSHARRVSGTVEIEAVAVTTDSCTRAGDLVAGAPAGQTPPAGSLPVTFRLERAGDAVCAMVVGRAERGARFPLSGDAATVHLYIVASDGRLVATERVPIR